MIEDENFQPQFQLQRSRSRLLPLRLGLRASASCEFLTGRIEVGDRLPGLVSAEPAGGRTFFTRCDYPVTGEAVDDAVILIFRARTLYRRGHVGIQDTAVRCFASPLRRCWHPRELAEPGIHAAPFSMDAWI